MSTSSSLLARLARSLGHGPRAIQDARNELRWMKQALESPPKGIHPSATSLQEMVDRRVRHEPLQYILGSVPFGPLHIVCRPPVLIPRMETEDWAANLADLLRPKASHARPLRLLDLCTGTGCIPLLLCHELPPGSVHATGVDISDHAVSLAAENARLNGVRVPAAPANEVDTHANTFTPVRADLMDRDFVRRARLQPPYDVITSNPPYIPLSEYALLDPSVRDYEDPRACLGDPVTVRPAPVDVPPAHAHKGLTFYHRIAALVRAHGLLRPDGWLVLEVGAGQHTAVEEIVRGRTGLTNVQTWHDPAGRGRVVVARGDPDDVRKPVSPTNHPDAA